MASSQGFKFLHKDINSIGKCLKIFFSRTTRPISTKLGRKHAWGWEFRFVQIKGLDNFDKSSKIFFS